ncbi:MerR family transcriptional regulator [Mesorhizobium sp. YC-39]|uniref:MerR family transcriptional regulator n=1 Tax=unclassified Mesorhizobium TaxID=325217 RepID=UPI0021E95B5A|nr:MULTISPECIES: MerR family transcriptional regulator [unclassified Mesorhizobium]MCV3210332.1 MerR family transcriptional regulator [Mesorhizobium sp. YC-2]MCV3230862.1 MerR family transcriptional regulator [Mesorhizobium sp. YC-39]
MGSRFLNAASASSRLGVSAKALRLYEEHGLIAPDRTPAGWRAYGPEDMRRAAEIVALRALGFSLAEVARVLKGDAHGLEPALAAHQATLEGRLRQLAGTIEKVGSLRERLARGDAPTAGDLARLTAEPGIAVELPWPWGGECFELGPVRALNYIIGPLGSGKTRLARRLAESLPNASFLGLDRLADGAAVLARMDADPALRARVDRTLAWLVEDGAAVSDALLALLAGLEAEGPAILVVDMIEQGLGQASQEALIAHLRRRGPGGRPLFLLTRSSAILDLAAVGADEVIILCPANHSPPTYVAPYPGTPGYEAVATCLASPEVRARTEGVIAWRPEVA